MGIQGGFWEGPSGLHGEPAITGTCFEMTATRVADGTAAIESCISTFAETGE